MRNIYFLSFLILIISCNQKQEQEELANEIVGANKLPQVIDYNLHVKPILSDKCFACHGPDAASQKAGLALHTADRAYSELKKKLGHFAIIPYDPKNSEVIRRILIEEENKRMPPPEFNLTLSQYEKDVLVAWVDQGAKYKKHWSLIPVQKPEIPDVANQEWVSNPIDNFILSKLEEKRWTPEPKAEKGKLLRRVFFDLTGLPPTEEDLDNYLSDDNPDAFEKAVDRLLASKAYGERMAFRWLDMARYADSHGYQDDFYRSMWPWRDWVIGAYNENKSFKEFLTEQLAGDLLPDANIDQILATGFQRNHAVNMEAGIIFEEYKAEYVSDRTNTLGTAVMGLTLECAKCHDHKYDEISQKEYFQVFSFFNQMDEKWEWNVPAVEPTLEYPEERVEEIRDYIDGLANRYIDKAETRSAQVRNTIDEDAMFADWLAATKNSSKEQVIPKALVYESFDNESINKLPYEVSDDSLQFSPSKPGKYGRGMFLKDQEYVVGSSEFISKDKPFSFSFWYYNYQKVQRKFIVSQLDEKKRGVVLQYNDGGKILVTVHDGKLRPAAIKLVSKNLIKHLEWIHVVLTYDGSGNSNGFKLYLDGKPEILEWGVNKELPEFATENELALGHRVPPYWPTDPYVGKGLFGSGVDEFFAFDRVISLEEANAIGAYDPVQNLALRSFKSLDSDEQNQLFDEFLFQYDDEFRSALQNYFAAEYKYLDVPKDKPVYTMVMSEPKAPKVTNLLQRGAYDAPGEEVDFGTPSAILNWSDTLPQNRLGLAQWFFQQDHPLTSRVAVNRYWEYLFGRGIVKTVDDFGNQGDFPSHPELLDWLAATFTESDWDVKAMIKLIVMSSTYQQSSVATMEKRALDPENIYLARSPRSRLPVEMIRDQALAASNLLNNRIGGPSVRPYQPEGLWAEATGGSGGPLERYVLDVTEDQYRRSLYTFWKRTLPPPSIISFDGATRDKCIVQRQSTNTPLQALVLLNNPVFMEAARATAQELMEDSANNEEVLRRAFRRFTGRYPSEGDLEDLNTLYETSLSNFKKDKNLVKDLLKIGSYPIDTSLDLPRLAANTLAVNSIMNLDETITKE